MGSAAARALTLQRVQVFGSPHLTHTAICTRQLRPGLQGVPALIRSNNINRNFFTGRSSLANSCKSFNISTAMDSSFSTNGFIVTRASMKPSFGSPRGDLHLGTHGFSRGLASAVPPDSELVASTSASSTHDAEDSSPKGEDKKKSSQGLGFFAIGAGIFSTILSYIIKLCGGGYTPYVKQAEEDIDKVADFVDEGARLVVKVADEIEEIAHVADVSAQEAEDLALKVEAKTKVVRETLDAICDVLEGDKKLSTVLTDYANMKKETTETKKGS
ncbi:hypothetical protein KC19_8G053300 [Ceratodon purpureus]|uniref:Uncharacterized protein n=1 Tax=Ceratodon purpureus TaxID=3225 RepID=A0A8T0H0X4_CERPU|nr:hypothetical protein KC19_8G053300 [Ceratodon purpureus]